MNNKRKIKKKNFFLKNDGIGEGNATHTQYTHTHRYIYIYTHTHRKPAKGQC